MLHICCIINDTRLHGGTIDVGMGHQPEKKMGHTKVDEEAKKNGVGQLRLLFSCCLSLSSSTRKRKRELSIAEEAGKRSLCFRAVSLETRPWEEKLTSKARKLSLLRKRSASHPHLAGSSPCPEPLFAFCFFDFRD